MTTATVDAPRTAPATPLATDAPETPEPIRKMSIILSKGSLDMVYPALILANAARMSGIEATLFFTFWGLDPLQEKKVDKLHVPTVGNPSLPIPTWLGGFPGMESLVSGQMKKQMEEMDLPTVREMLEILHDSGAEIFACRMAMDMFKLTEDDLVPYVDGVISAMDFYDKSAGAQVVFI